MGRAQGHRGPWRGLMPHKDIGIPGRDTHSPATTHASGLSGKQDK
jgi:hypothetical protein